MTHILPNGDLRITADNMTRRVLNENYKDYGHYAAWSLVLEMVRNDVIADRDGTLLQLDDVPPEDLGALTSAPILGDVEYPDEGGVKVVGPVFWFPSYAVESEIEELIRFGRVVFTRAPEGEG